MACAICFCHISAIFAMHSSIPLRFISLSAYAV